MVSLRYVIITPARNEASFIENTIQSMIAQTIPPTRWIIVSDGSTDGTDDIVKKYLPEYPWMELIRMPQHRDRQFAAKVHAFNAGYERIQNLSYEIVGNLDADITFEPDHFEYLIGKFAQISDLGVAGTPFVEDTNVTYDFRFSNIEHVSGACQLFKRECFVEIGGYIPIKGGGIDWTAVTTARMKGWKTCTFTEKICYHHRKMGTENENNLMKWFALGKKDYFLGGHPLWQVFRSIYQAKSKPYVLSGILLLAGYTWAALIGFERPISKDLMDFHRKEQLTRLKKALSKESRLSY